MLLLDSPALSIVTNVVDRYVEGRGGPYLEWLKVDIAIRTPRFSGEVTWLAQPSELLSFVKGLDEMAAMKSGAVAVLEGVEPGVSLQLALGVRGDIAGRYRFCGAGGELDTVELSGEFWIDQTFVASIRSVVRDILAVPARKVGA